MTTTAIGNARDDHQAAENLAGEVFDALADPGNIDLVALTRAANRYLDTVKATTPPIRAKARAAAMSVIDLNLPIPAALDNLKRASRELELERIKR